MRILFVTLALFLFSFSQAAAAFCEIPPPLTSLGGFIQDKLKENRCQDGDTIAVQLHKDIVPEWVAGQICRMSESILIGNHGVPGWHWLVCVLDTKKTAPN